MKKTLLLFLFFFPLLISTQDLKPLTGVDDVKNIFDSLKSKVILVNFWATWCTPCITEFPDLMKLRTTYYDRGFELVFISTDPVEDIESRVKPFLKKNGVDFTSYYVNSENDNKLVELMDYFDKKWQGAIPQTYIYDRENVLKANILGSRTYEVFEKEIIKLLN